MSCGRFFRIMAAAAAAADSLLFPKLEFLLQLPPVPPPLVSKERPGKEAEREKKSREIESSNGRHLIHPLHQMKTSNNKSRQHEAVRVSSTLTRKGTISTSE
jgi:hypothetical protein